MISRKVFAILKLMIVVMTAMIVVAGCIGGGQETQNGGSEPNNSKTEVGGQTSSGSNEQIKLRYMIWDNNQAPAYQQALDLFMEKNPNIQVQLEVVPWNDYWNKLKTQIAGEVMPDLFWTYVAPIPDLASRGVLLDITPYIQRDGIDLNQWNETLVSNLQYEGAQYGMPKDWDALALFYNQDLVRKAGLDEVPSDLKWNPEDGGTFVEFLQKLTVDKNGKHPNEEGFDPNNIAQYGFYAPNMQPHNWISFISSNGGTVLDENKKVVIDSTETKEALRFYYDLIYKYHVMPAPSEVEAVGDEAMFYSSKLAVWMTGPWMLKPVNENAPFEWGITYLPEGPQGRIVRINGLSDSIYAKTKYPEEAWEVAKFLAGKETQDILGETGTVFPAWPESIPKFLEYYKSLGLDATIFVEEFNGKTVGDPAALKYDELNAIWKKYMSQAFANELELETAIENIVKEGNALAE